MPTTDSPVSTRWVLTKHAHERMEQMGVAFEEVASVLASPEISYPSSTSSVVSSAGRLTIPYNPTTGEVITVLWRSQEWLPDRINPPEEQGVNWQSITQREAEKLLEKWGFQRVEYRGFTTYWTHPLDPEKQRIPFLTHGASPTSKNNSRGSFVKAAEAVGVNVRDFLQGPTAARVEEFKAKTNDQATALPRKVATLPLKKKEEKPLSENRSTAAWTTQMSRPKQEVLDAVKTALSMEPLTQTESEWLTDLKHTTCYRALQFLLMEGAIARRNAKNGEIVKRQRSPKALPTVLYFIGDHVPPRTSPISLEDRVSYPPVTVAAAKMAESAAAPSVEEKPVIQIDLTQPEPAIEQTAPVMTEPVITAPPPETAPLPIAPPMSRLFEDTGLPWPDGGNVLRDNDGKLWVAMPLVVGTSAP